MLREAIYGLGMALLALSPAAAQAPASGVETPAAVARRVCTGCHSLEIVLDTPKDFDAWHDTVQKMIDHGAQGSPDDFEQIMQYLFETMTTVNVNTGDQEELATVLHVPTATADIIIARRAKLLFKTIGELESLPGADAKLLESKKRMIFF